MKNRGKRYLHGIDWAINGIDYISKKSLGHGNSAQIILFFKQRLPEQNLRNVLTRVIEQYPILTGKVARGWNLCPYWKVTGKHILPGNIPLSVEIINHDRHDDIMQLCSRWVNGDFTSDYQHLRFCLIHAGRERSCLAMHFDHRLFDAFGAEMFLDLLVRVWEGSDQSVKTRIKLTAPALLGDWKRRFQGGRKINRHHLELSRDGIDSLGGDVVEWPRKTIFRTFSFSVEQTELLLDKAYREVGYMMLIPALLARTARAFDPVFKQRGSGAGNYVVPITIADRPPGQDWENLLFNHISFLFLQIPESALSVSDQELGLQIRSQLYEQMKNKLADDLSHAAMLTRIAPLQLMRWLAKIPMQGKVGSFYFSCLKETGFKHDKFLGVEVDNLLHTPHMPMPPGIGLTVNLFRRRLNMTLAYSQGIITPGEESQIIDQLSQV